MSNKYIDSSFIDKAIIFAVKAHANTERRGKGFPYIIHPLEALEIVSTMTSDRDLLAAAVLHDTVEDTEVTLEQLRAEFGDRVAKLVEEESDTGIPGFSKELCWRERKQLALDRLKCLERDAKIVTMGDKLSNMRAIARDYRTEGDSLWNRFHAPNGKVDHCWRYHALADALSDLEDTEAYKEFVGLVNDIFPLDE